MGSTDLLPCPFCGGAALLIEGHREHWRAQCSKCGANIGEFFANRSRQEDQQLATEAWNTRTPDYRNEAARLREALEKVRATLLDGDDGFEVLGIIDRALSPHPSGERG
jgi:Lar family restriction alleviation protein